ANRVKGFQDFFEKKQSKKSKKERKQPFSSFGVKVQSHLHSGKAKVNGNKKLEENPLIFSKRSCIFSEIKA
ncbi:hypothetical protein EBR77_04800, partial [bacterium]|nr:hypothetical protein [bacterium]